MRERLQEGGREINVRYYDKDDIIYAQRYVFDALLLCYYYYYVDMRRYGARALRARQRAPARPEARDARDERWRCAALLRRVDMPGAPRG